MYRRAGLVFVALFSLALSAFAQPVNERSEFESGIAAMDAHDPTAAIAHFERAHGKEARAWLAVALMMESRAPSDQYVQRAFDAAAQARSEHPERLRSRTELAAALRPGDIVVAFLAGEQHAYAWAFDRRRLIGYPLPPTPELATAVERIDAYVKQHDPTGVQRIADDLAPALLGPVLEWVPTLSRIIFVMDGPLRRLPVRELFSEETSPGLERLAVSVADDESLLGEIGRRASPRQPPTSAWLRNALLAGPIALGILISLLARRRSRARS